MHRCAPIVRSLRTRRRRSSRRRAGGDVGVDRAEQGAEGVRVSLDVSGRERRGGDAGGGHHGGILLGELVGPPPVADPQPFRVGGLPRQGGVGAVDLPRHVVLAPGGHLRHGADAARPTVVAQQQSGGVVTRHGHPRALAVGTDGGGGERLHLAGRTVALADEGVQVGEHLRHLLTGHEAGQVDPVRADVGHRPQRALAFGVESPVPVGLEQQPVLQVVPADQPRCADRPGGHLGGGVLVLGVVAQVEADGVDDAGGLRPFHQVGRLGGVDAERLLADHGQAGVDDGAGLGGVDVVRAGDVHRLQAGHGEQLVERVERRRQQRVGLGPGARR